MAFYRLVTLYWASQVELMVENLPANSGDKRRDQFDPRSGKSPGGGHGNPLQYSFLENPMDRRARRATVHGVAKSWTQLKRLSTHSQALLYAHFTGEETETHEGKYKVTLTSLVIPVSSAPDCRETCVTEPNTLGLS